MPGRAERQPEWSSDWLSGEGPFADVVMSSRVRLARNFAGFPFVNRAKRGDRLQIMDLAQRRILGCGLAPQMIWIDLNEQTPLDRSLLVERHLISREHAKGDEPRAVAISTPDERLSIMINEEDHMRLQVLLPGLSLSEAFRQTERADDLLEEQIDYAFSPRFGYCTACPTNIGTGIRVSVMLHLPALKLTGEIEKVKRAAQSMNLAIRGFYGEGSEAIGDFYQVSNQTTLGKSEPEILTDLEQRIIPKVIEYERIARRGLLEKRRLFFEDQVLRALGVLRHARLLKSDEALQLLSHLRMGVSAGIVPEVEPAAVHRLILLSQTAHLQKAAGREMDQSERRVERATLIRERLRQID